VSDAVLTRDGPVSVPLDYVVPAGGELLPLMVRATMDGTSSAGPFYAVVQVIAPSGRVMGTAITSSVAAGASADVTWFPGPGIGQGASQGSVRTLNVVINGNGAVIATGVVGDLELDFAATILRWTLLADQSGSIVVDIWKTAYAGFPPTVANTITGSALPTITAAQNAQSSTLTGWTTAIAAGDTLRFNVNSVATVKRVTLAIDLQT
jgi:hypothetical protein